MLTFSSCGANLPLWFPPPEPLGQLLPNAKVHFTTRADSTIMPFSLLSSSSLWSWGRLLISSEWIACVDWLCAIFSNIFENIEGLAHFRIREYSREYRCPSRLSPQEYTCTLSFSETSRAGSYSHLQALGRPAGRRPSWSGCACSEAPIQ